MLRRAGQSLCGKLGQRQSQAEKAITALKPTVAVSEETVEGARHASTLLVKQRMKSVGNISKITKAMKMVAASKMRSAQVNTENARGIAEPLLKLLGDLPDAQGKKNVYVPITSDKGLCGGINTTVCKYTRAAVKAESGEDKEHELFVMGEKGRSQLQRDMRDSIYATVVDTGKARITFPLAATIADMVQATDYDVARLVYNRFHSAISFKPTLATVLSPDALEREAESGSLLDQYEIEGPDRAELLQDLSEFHMAVAVFNGMMENNCSEQASRMSAMENSTKNAEEMLGKLTLTYNRTRQATITTELIEIISGATALAG